MTQIARHTQIHCLLLACNQPCKMETFIAGSFAERKGSLSHMLPRIRTRSWGIGLNHQWQGWMEKANRCAALGLTGPFRFNEFGRERCKLL